jgi:hypothetical protein
MRSLALVQIVSLLTISLSAHAGGPGERAAAIFRQAQQAFERRNYAAAAAAFEEAALLQPHAAAWLDAGEAWERDGNLVRSAEDCDRAVATEGISAAHRAEAEARLSRLVPKIGTLDVRSDKTLVMKVDGGNESNVPGQRRVTVGKHVLEFVDLAGAEKRRMDIEVSPGQVKLVELKDEPPPPPPPPKRESPAIRPPPPPARSGPPTVSVVAFGVSLAAVATAVVAGSITLSRQSDFQSAPTEDKRDGFYTARTTTNVAWGVAGASAITGLAFWLFAPRVNFR